MNLSAYPRTSVASPGMGGLGGAGVTIPFVAERQLQDQWCWAAVAASVSKYKDPPGRDQCDIVNAELKQLDCCQNGSSAQCDQPHYLHWALERVNRLQRAYKGTAAHTDVKTELKNNVPVGIRVEWQANGGGHFLAIHGEDFGPGGPIYALTDPLFGPGVYSEAALMQGRYRPADGSGRWTHTYLVKP